MKWIASFETRSQVVARLGLGRRAVHCGPLRGKFSPMFEAPIPVSQRDGSTHRFLADIIEEPATDYFPDLGFIVYQQILGDALDDLGDSLLPLRVPLGHLDLAPRQA